jgi:hypothetical protein
MITMASDWCTDFDDFRAAQDADEGAREHDAQQCEYIAGDEDPAADVPF